MSSQDKEPLGTPDYAAPSPVKPDESHPDTNSHRSDAFADTIKPVVPNQKENPSHSSLTSDHSGREVNSSDRETARTIPKTIGRFEIQETLGRGGFGTVYRAYDTQLNRHVAIKAPHRHVLKSQDDVDRFLKEARDLAQLRHPAIVTVFDLGIDEGQCYIVSDYIEGMDLERWLKQSRPTWLESVAIVADIADALAHAHARRIVHRDLKPGNILLTSDQKPVLVDFGLAVSDTDAGDPGKELGLVAGTVTYMSPEQAAGRGHRIDGRTDIYALGVVLYRMLCGRVPFHGSTAMETLRQVREDEPQPPRQIAPHVPSEVEAICLKAMSKSLNDRYTTASDFAEKLRQALKAHLAPIKLQPPFDSGGQSGASISLDPTISQKDGSSSSKPEAPQSAEPSKVPSSVRSRTASSIRRAREAERRQVTMMFCVCDLFETSQFLEEVDPQDQHRILRDYQKLCDEIIEEFDATLVQSGNEGVLVCFGYPLAHEDSTRRSVQAALKLQERVKMLCADLKREHLDLAPWIGLHTGHVVIGESTGVGSGHDMLSIVGEPRSIVTRLDHVAEPGMVLVSEATKRLTAGYFDFESLGPFRFKGVSQKLEFFQVTGERPILSRIERAAHLGELTPLTGRDQEVGLLVDRWDQAVEGMGQIVLLIGEAGLGKSRLVYTIKEYVLAEQQADERPQQVVEWFCSPLHANSSLYAAREYFERLLNFQPEDAPADRLDRLARHLEDISLYGDEEFALLASLLALPLDGRCPPLEMSPDLRRQRTIELLQDWLREMSRDRPLLFIVEDLHWVDPSTLEFLEYHVAEGLNDSVLTILTFRPEFQTPWSSLAHQTQVALNRLTKRQIAEMMQRKSSLNQIPSHIVQSVIDRTDGVPLFVEEFTTMVMQTGTLREIDGETEMSATFPVTEIPATLQDLLLARLDRMASDMDIVQLASVLGREFNHDLIRAVTELDEAELQTELDKLTLAELIYQKGRPPRCVYIFKHALIQDAAYQSLLKDKRRQFHLRVAKVLEEQKLQADPALLAWHFTEAGELEQGIHYWRQAAILAAEKSAHAETINCVNRGLALVERLEESPHRDELELALKVPLGAALVSTRGYAAPEVGPVYDRARELCERVGDKWNSFAVLFGIWAWRLVRDELILSLKLSEDIMSLAELLGDPGIMMEAQHVPANSLYYLGDFEAARKHCEDGFALYDEDRCQKHCHRSGQNSGVTLQSYWALANWHLGYPDQALERIESAIDLANHLKHPFSQCYSRHFSAWVHQYARLGEKTLEYAEAEQKLADKHGFAFWSATSRLYRSSALLLLDRADEALDVVQEGLETIKATGAALSLPYYYSFLAEAQQRTGRLEEALRTLDHSLEIAADTQDRYYEAELFRRKGELLLEQSADLSTVEACLEKALEIAQVQRSKSWELRIAMSLSRLRNKQGRSGEGLALLSEVYGWFREGFSTPDLVDAKRMLEESD